MCYCLFNADLTIEARVKGFRKAIQSIIYLFIINFSQKDRGHTKGEPVLGAPLYTHTYIHTYNYKDKTQKTSKTYQ